MSRRIPELTSDELMDAVRTGGLDDLEVLEVLRSPFCTAQIAEFVASSREHLATQSVREKLAGFPGLSNARAIGLLGSLSWGSLLAVAQTPRTPPLVRRQAERKLIMNVPTMTLGEKVALARRAHRALFSALITGGDDMVLGALLDNPRVVENDIVVIINTGSPPAEFYREVARHRKWSQCYGVRRALVECPSVPLPLALSVLVQLPAADHSRIATATRYPERVREAAAALLAEGRSSRVPGGRGSGSPVRTLVVPPAE